MPALAKRAPVETWRLRLPGGYDSARQLLMTMFPDVSASGFHYYSPNIATQPEGPSLSMTLNLATVSAKATDKVFSQEWHLVATGVDVAVGIPGTGTSIGIVCKELVADVVLWSPTITGEFGTLKANLKGEVLLRIPVMPGMPGYYYVGPELAVEWTLVEPRYTIVAPSVLGVPQGTVRDAAVTVTPLEVGIAGQVGLGFECKDLPAIQAEFVTSTNTPPLTATMKVHVQPFVKPDTYPARIIVNDWTTGKQYYHNLNIIVTESGFDVLVNGANPFNLGSIPKGTESSPLTVTILPFPADYQSPGGEFGWRPLDDLNGIGIDVPTGGIGPLTRQMVIKVGLDAISGVHVVELYARDFADGQEFKCLVTFTVAA